MNETKSSRGKSPLDSPRLDHYRGKHRRHHGRRTPALFIGSLVLGIGLISWALVNIGSQPVGSADTYRGPTSTPTTVAVEQVGSTLDDAAPTEPDRSSQTPSPEKVLYPEYPAEGDRIGTLSIPALKQTLPIIEGTDADELRKGIGHFAQSVLPGEADNCVLSGHRDTVFRRLGELKIGDRLTAQTSAGKFTYEIQRIRIVHKDDRTVIVPFDHAVLTVTTCYPFRFVGSAPDRYILIADLVAPQQVPRSVQ